MTAAERIAHWLAQADTIAPFNAGAAVAFRQCAAELEADVRAAATEVLTLEQAAAESGMHRDSLRHLVSAGRIPNAGRRGAPRIRRADLPRKPKMQSVTGYDPQRDALAIAARATRAGNVTQLKGHR